MEVFWKNQDLFRNLVIMMGRFHLLMMLLGIIGHRFGDASLTLWSVMLLQEDQLKKYCLAKTTIVQSECIKSFIKH